jgi:hypothetical protein
MLKKYFISLLFLLVLSSSIIPKEYANGAASKNHEIPENLFLALLMPYVDKAIDNYYSEFMTYLPGEDPWSYQILSIEKVPDKNYSFILKLEVSPYVGPHLSVGKDRITLKIEPSGVTTEKFEHLKSYPLPPNWQSILKGKWPVAENPEVESNSFSFL